MKIEFWFIGKTNHKYLQTGMDDYLGRINHYITAGVTIIPASKMKNHDQIRTEESKNLLSGIKPGDFVVLLDEHGKQYTSVDFAGEINKWIMNRVNKVIFITGGAYGVSAEVKKRGDLVLSFSKFTFTHELIRLILLEQVYRACTINRGEKYHHQ